MQITHSQRRAQLQELEKSLVILCELLQLDRRCHWLPHFERCLHTTRRLLADGFEQSELNDLSGAVRSVFGGMGSFNDYMPIMNTKESSAWYQRHSNPENVIRSVFDTAVKLMVVSERHG